MEIDLTRFIPKEIGNKIINIEKIGSKLIVSAKGTGSPKQLVLNQTIDFNNFLFEVIGLYFGDGLNSRKHCGNRRVSFANSNYVLHEYWLRFLGSFGIDKTQINCQIGIGANINKEFILNYWTAKTEIQKDKFSKLNIKQPKSCNEGVLSINFDSIIFRKIFDNLFDYCIKFLKENAEYIPSFIAGVFAAEGRVALKGESLNYLGIAVKNSVRREYLKSLLRKINVNPSKDNRFQEIIIHGYINFKTFNELNIERVHPDKYKKFNNGFENLLKSNANGLTKIKIIDLLKLKPMTRHQIAEKLNRDISIVHKMLRDLEIKDVVIRLGKEKSIRKSRDIWTLSKMPEDISCLMTYDYNKKTIKN